MVLPTIAPQPFGAVCDNVDSVRLPVSRAALLRILPGKQLCLPALWCVALSWLLLLWLLAHAFAVTKHFWA